MSNFYIVATPIGNMQDITLRALEVLKTVDIILCEDTRTTGRLLERHGIKNHLMSYHAQSKLAKVDKIFELIEEGKNIALVSDAGTPTISDPGALLISKIKDKFADTVEASRWAKFRGYNYDAAAQIRKGKKSAKKDEVNNK